MCKNKAADAKINLLALKIYKTASDINFRKRGGFICELVRRAAFSYRGTAAFTDLGNTSLYG
jgi:hypothetical protein